MDTLIYKNLFKEKFGAVSQRQNGSWGCNSVMHLDSSGLRTREGLSVFSMTNFILFVKVVLIKKLLANTHTHTGELGGRKGHLWCLWTTLWWQCGTDDIHINIRPVKMLNFVLQFCKALWKRCIVVQDVLHLGRNSICNTRNNSISAVSRNAHTVHKYLCHSATLTQMSDLSLGAVMK